MTHGKYATVQHNRSTRYTPDDDFVWSRDYSERYATASGIGHEAYEARHIAQEEPRSNHMSITLFCVSAICLIGFVFVLASMLGLLPFQRLGLLIGIEPETVPIQKTVGTSSSGDTIASVQIRDDSKKTYKNVSQDDFYRSKLEDDLVDDYDSILECIENMSEKASVNCSEKEMSKCLSYVFYDHPEIFWTKLRYSFDKRSDNGRPVSIRPSYTFDGTDERDRKAKELEEKIDDIAMRASKGADNDYEKIRNAYSLIVKGTEYDEKAENSQNIISVLDAHVSACAGYSKAFKMVLNRMGIYCIYASGHTEKNGKKESHVWNMMEIDGNKYWTDVTWGDAFSDNEKDSAGADINITYAYMVMNDDEMSCSHTLDEPELFPKSTGTEYSYANVANGYMKNYDERAMRTRLYSGLMAGETDIYFQFSQRNDFEKLLEKSETGDCGFVYDALDDARVRDMPKNTKDVDTCIIYSVADTKTVVMHYENSK